MTDDSVVCLDDDIEYAGIPSHRIFRNQPQPEKPASDGNRRARNFALEIVVVDENERCVVLQDESIKVNFEPPQEVDVKEILSDLLTAEENLAHRLELTELEEHVMSVRTIEDAQRYLPCDFCSKICDNFASWEKHTKDVHIRSDSVPCLKCRKQFTSYAWYKDHTNVHYGLRPYVCHSCRNYFCHRVSLMVHQIVKHPESKREEDRNLSRKTPQTAAKPSKASKRKRAK